jgi:hypothetical protein
MPCRALHMHRVLQVCSKLKLLEGFAHVARISLI